MKRLDEKVYTKLVERLGEDNVSQNPAVLDGYAWQPALNLTDREWIPRPAAVALRRPRRSPH